MVFLSLSRSAERLFVRFARGIAFEKSAIPPSKEFHKFPLFKSESPSVFLHQGITGNGSHCVHEPTSEEWMCEKNL